MEACLVSAKFEALSPRTQKDHRRNADVVLKEFGRGPIAAFEDKRIRADIIKWRNELAKRSPRQADYALATLRLVLSYADDCGQISNNHAKGIEKIYRHNRSDKRWEDADIEAIIQHATPEMSLALRLALDTAQRQSDLICLTWTQFDGRRIHLRQRKTKTPVSVPCTELLRAQLENTLRRAITILTGQRGRPWTADGFKTE